MLKHCDFCDREVEEPCVEEWHATWNCVAGQKEWVEETAAAAGKVTNFKFSHAEFESWRRQTRFATPEMNNLAMGISGKLKDLERGERGDTRAGLIRKHLLEDLNKLRTVITSTGTK